MHQFVFQEIAENPQRLHEVEPAGERGAIGVHAGHNVPAVQEPGDLALRRAEQILGHVELGRDRKSAALEPRQIEQVVDQATEAVSLLLDHPRVLVTAERRILGEGLDRSEGRAQVVRDGRQQHVFHAIGLAQRRRVLGLGSEPFPLDRFCPHELEQLRRNDGRHEERRSRKTGEARARRAERLLRVQDRDLRVANRHDITK